MALVTLHSPRTKRQLAALECATATEIIEWALDTYGTTLCVTTSFADTVLVHLATQVNPDIEVLFLDTGYHFPETLDTMRTAMARYQLRLRVVRPEDYPHPTPLPHVWADDTTTCCEARKVRPLNEAMTDGGFEAWLSGLRRADSPERRNAPIVDTDRTGRTKINPLANWTDDAVAQYISRHDLLVNPLLNLGYDSVGCWPCTEPGAGRTGRWSDDSKTECGLHLTSDGKLRPGTGAP